jgi:hypothetical protein
MMVALLVLLVLTMKVRILFMRSSRSVLIYTKRTVHCPKTHEQFQSCFGNAEVISSDRRKLFINIFFQSCS